MHKTLDCYFVRILLFLLVLLLGSVKFSQTISAQDLTLVESYIVTLQISLVDGEPVTVTVYEGGMARFQDSARRYAVGITPYVSDAANGLLELRIQRLGDGADVKRADQSITISGQVGFTSVTSVGNQPLDVRIVKLAPESGQVDQQCFDSAPMQGQSSTSECGSDQEQLLFQNDGCCVSCGGQSTCGCAVSTSCGTCCNCFFC